MMKARLEEDVVCEIFESAIILVTTFDRMVQEMTKIVVREKRLMELVAKFVVDQARKGVIISGWPVLIRKRMESPTTQKVAQA